MRRFLAGLVLFAAFAAAPSAILAAQSVPVRAADHGSFGRIVFDWPQPVGHSLEVRGHELAVSFDRPMDASFVRVLKRLKYYVTAARLDDGARTAVFVLAGEFSADAFENGNSVAVDIRAPGAPAKAAAAESIRVRTGIHPTFSRIVFDWPRDVAYTVRETPGALTLDFAAPAEFALGSARAKLPPHVTAIEPAASQAGASVTIRSTSGARFKHFRSKTKVVVDVSVPESTAALRPADGPAPPAAPDTREKDASPEPPAPAPKKRKVKVAELDSPGARDSAGAPVSLLPVKPRPAPENPPRPDRPKAGQSLDSNLSPAGRAVEVPLPKSEDATAEPEASAPVSLLPDPAPEPAPAEAKPDSSAARVKPKNKNLPGNIRLAPPKTGPGAPLAVSAESIEGGLALTFPLTQPVPAAVFRRASNVWIVFGRETRLDLSALAEWHKEIAGEPVAVSGATALRLAAGKGLHAAVTRDGAAMTVRLTAKPAAAKSALAPEGQANKLFIPVKSAGPVVRLRDPAVGDVLSVVPVTEPQGMAAREYALFRLPATAAGVVVEPKADGIVVRADARGVAVTSPGGLMLSEANGGLPATALAGEPDALPKDAVDVEIGAPHLFDFAGWARTGAPFEETRKYLQHAVLAAQGAARTEARLDLARFYFARGFYTDALGLLRVAATDDPRVANEPGFLALRGACHYLMEDFAAATADLNNPMLLPNPEAQLWRGAIAASQGLWPEAVRAFAQVGDRIQAYPVRIKTKFALLATETAVESNEFEAAETYLGFVEETQPDRAAAADVKYLRGKLAETRRDYETAATLYAEAAEEGDPATAAKAKFAGVAMLWNGKKIRPEEAIAALEELRFAWRGDSFEFEVLKTLGDLYLTTGDYEKGLKTLKRAVTFFPDHADATAAAETMSETFSKLYVEGEADDLSPLKALGLYNEFKELTPPGEAGEKMSRKLVERLVAVDLLDQAAAVLEPQVRTRLEGEEKAKWGARLATIRLLDKRPGKAIEALEMSAVARIPPELDAERRRLRARALSDQGKTPEALAALEGLEGRGADLLRAEILWRQQDWGGAAAVLARLTDPLLPESGQGVTLEEPDAALVVKRAAALWMADDGDALDALRARFAPAMAATPYAADFKVIAAAPMGAIDSIQTIADRVADIDAYADFAARLKGGLVSDAAESGDKKEVAAANE